MENDAKHFVYVMAAAWQTPLRSEILDALANASPKWRLIGSMLHVGKTILDQIEADCRNQGVMHMLMRVVDEYHQKSIPNWQQIVEVLRSDALNEGGLASRIEEKYGPNCTTPTNHSTGGSPVNHSTSHPEPVYSLGRPPMQHYRWFHETLTREDATRLLESCTKHSFLVRYSGTFQGHYALSVRGDVLPKHFQIKCEIENRTQSMWVDGTITPFTSLEELVVFYHENDLDGDLMLKSPCLKQQNLQFRSRSLPAVGSDMSDGITQPKPCWKNLVPITWCCDSKWELPVEMVRPHVVRIGSDVYFGGECAMEIREGEIRRFNETESRWYSVCRCPTRRFGLTEWNGKLVTVGGLRNDFPSSCVYCLESFDTWEELPRLTVARADACTFAFNSYLITIGGIIEYRYASSGTIDSIVETSSIEILAKDSSSWMLVTCMLPVPLYSLSYAIISQTLYVLGGCNSMRVTADAFSISIPDLLDFDPRRPVPEFNTLPSCPLSGSTAAVVNGIKLLAIGGQCSATQRITDEVYAYSTSEKRWERVPSKLPAPRVLSSVVQLDGSRIVLVGGCEKQGDIKKTAFVN